MEAGTSSKIDLPPLIFHPQHGETVQRILSVANIKDSFSLIHWRGEAGMNMDYIKCAKYVIKTKQSITNKIAARGGHGDIETPSFILMSSISEDPELMWGQAKKMMMKKANNTAIEALHLLEQNGMIKFDKLINQAGIPILDSGMLAVYDLILATSANYFSTCSHKDSSRRHGKCSHGDQRACRACNHLGKFAALALAMREESPVYSIGSTYGCWPQR